MEQLFQESGDDYRKVGKFLLHFRVSPFLYPFRAVTDQVTGQSMLGSTDPTFSPTFAHFQPWTCEASKVCQTDGSDQLTSFQPLSLIKNNLFPLLAAASQETNQLSRAVIWRIFKVQEHLQVVKNFIHFLQDIISIRCYDVLHKGPELSHMTVVKLAADCLFKLIYIQLQRYKKIQQITHHCVSTRFKNHTNFIKESLS